MDYFKTLNRKETDSIKWKMGKDLVSMEDYYVFSVADSDYAVAPEIQEALETRVSHAAYGYAKPSKTYLDIHKKWFKNRYGLSVKPHQIIPVPKVLSALSIIIQQFSNKGDKVLIQTPVYHVFEPMIKGNERRVVDNPLKYDEGRYTIDYDLLEQQFKSGVKVMILTSPHNPVGRVWTQDELTRMVSLAKQYNVLIASDEIHADIIMEGHTFYSLGHYFDTYENIIIIGAGSKTFNIAGLHSAHIIVANSHLRSTLKKAYAALHMMGPNNLAQQAIMAAYTKCDYWVDLQNDHILSNYKILKSFMQTHYPTSHVVALEGTYLAWVQIDFCHLSSEVFMKELAKTQGVVVAEGKKFGGNGDQFIRLNLACSTEQLKNGLSRIETFIAAHKN